VWHGHHALPVNLDDAMTDAHAAPLSYTTTQQAADLNREKTLKMPVGVTENSSRTYLEKRYVLR
jgi:hypothetical protein